MTHFCILCKILLLYCVGNTKWELNPDGILFQTENTYKEYRIVYIEGIRINSGRYDGLQRTTDSG